jgi:SWI/SNF-related matrix-associated actin-dependent regulator 1 of chromatin subfamily A
MTVLSFPAPDRAILQPSTHARGARPYVYQGRIDPWHAPGLHVKNHYTSGAVDVAWSLERVAGRASRAPSMWPGVPGAAERARELGAKAGLFGYQQEGAAFLAERDYAANLDAMGGGKTAQSIIAAEARLSLGVVPVETPVVLVLCPALVKRHWSREIKRWTGHDSTVLDGLRPGPLPTTRYVIANYDIISGARRREATGVLRDATELPGWGAALAGRFLVAILDEMHMLRGRASRRTKAIKAVCRGIPVVWGLTGTPIPNYIRDVWSQVDILTDGLFGSYWDWARVYCSAHEAKYGWNDTGADRLDELQHRLAFFMLGRSKEAMALELPEKRREVFYVDVHASPPKLGDEVDAVTRHKLVASGLRATAKAKRPIVVEQALEALDNKQRVLVFVYMREQADAVAKAIKEAREVTVFCVHGELSPEGRDAQAGNFRQACAAGMPCVFVATIDSVGLGISLVGADLVIFGDLLAEPHKLLQAEARAHRIGSEHRVLVRYLIATGTVDEGIADRVIAKLATIEAALGKEADQQGLGELFGARTDESIIDGLFEKLKQWGRRDDVRATSVKL